MIDRLQLLKQIFVQNSSWKEYLLAIIVLVEIVTLIMWIDIWAYLVTDPLWSAIISVLSSCFIIAVFHTLYIEFARLLDGDTTVAKDSDRNVK